MPEFVCSLRESHGSVSAARTDVVKQQSTAQPAAYAALLVSNGSSAMAGQIHVQVWSHWDALTLAVTLGAQRLMWPPAHSPLTFATVMAKQRWAWVPADTIYDIASIDSHFRGPCLMCPPVSTRPPGRRQTFPGTRCLAEGQE